MAKNVNNSTTQGVTHMKGVIPTQEENGGDPFVDKGVKNRHVRFSRLKRKALNHVWLVRIALLIISLCVLSLIIIAVGGLISSTGLPKYANLLSTFISTPEGSIEEVGGRTNILLLGKGGEGHTAPDLTDTIIFISISHKAPSVSLVSIPRDIWVPEIRAKINSAYYWGNQKKEGGGLVLAKSSVEQIVGYPIQYGAVLNFEGFKKLIDEIGGITVDVERSFVDEKFPIVGKEDDECDGDIEFKCRYETLNFVQGKQLMDGETALKFVRSRNAEGVEGTDLAREARQRRVIEAIKNKILDPKFLINPRNIIGVKNILMEFVETDLDEKATTVLARRIIEGRFSIKSFTIPDGLLLNPPISGRYDNQYVFIPKSTSWNEVHAWINELLK